MSIHAQGSGHYGVNKFERNNFKLEYENRWYYCNSGGDKLTVTYTVLLHFKKANYIQDMIYNPFRKYSL